MVSPVGVLAVAAVCAAPSDGWFFRNQAAVRVNPFGLFDEGRLGYRWTLAPWASVSAAANASLSPAFARAGASFDLQLASVLNLSAIYEGGGYFGTFGLVQSFADADTARWSDADRAGVSGYPAAMHQLILGAYLNVHLGRVILRSNNRLVFQQVALRPGDTVFYDQNWETLFPNGGFISVNDVDALVQLMPGLRAGARYDLTHPFLTGSVDGTTQRLGPLVSYEFFQRARALFNAPTLSLVVNWWLEHPSRRGPVPYVGLAFTFRSESA